MRRTPFPLWALVLGVGLSTATAGNPANAGKRVVVLGLDGQIFLGFTIRIDVLDAGIPFQIKSERNLQAAEFIKL